MHLPHVLLNRLCDSAGQYSQQLLVMLCSREVNINDKACYCCDLSGSEQSGQLSTFVSSSFTRSDVIVQFFLLKSEFTAGLCDITSFDHRCLILLTFNEGEGVDVIVRLSSQGN